MAFYDFACDACNQQAEIYCAPSRYGPELFPVCPGCGERMHRIYTDPGHLAFRSKGIFPCYMDHMESQKHGDSGPVYCDSYQDYKRKLKERGLAERAPTKNNSHILHNRWI